MTNKLIFIPNGIMTPDIYIMISMAQSLIDDKKNKVTIITCGGKNNYACSKNIYAVKEICRTCILQRNNAISQLKGKFKLQEINTEINYKLTFQLNNIKQVKYENLDLGLGAYSSYTNFTRDSDLKGRLAKKSIKLLLNTSISIYHYFKDHLKNKNYDEIVTFNSRMSERRPLFKYSQMYKLNISNYEKLTTERFYNFKNKFSQDRIFIKKEIYTFLKKKKNLNLDKINKFYINKYHGIRDDINSEIYSSKQRLNFFPTNWDNSLKNIVFFTASDDEYQSFGKEFNPSFLGNQKNIIRRTCDLFKYKKNYFLWIRIHPRWKNEKWFDKNFYNLILKKYKNVGVIYPDEKISSYSIALKAYNVICYWSLLITELAYWKNQKIISLSKNDYSEIGIAVTPKSLNDYKQLIFNKPKKDKKVKQKTLEWAYFFLNGGSKIKYFKGSFEKGYTFRGIKFKFNFISFYYFIIGKVKEKIINSIN